MPGWEGLVLVLATAMPPSYSLCPGVLLWLPAGWQEYLPVLGQYKREAPAKKELRVLEVLRLAQDRLERLGWGHRAGPSRLEEPVYLLPVVGLGGEEPVGWTVSSPVTPVHKRLILQS